MHFRVDHADWSYKLNCVLAALAQAGATDNELVEHRAALVSAPEAVDPLYDELCGEDRKHAYLREYPIGR